MFVFHVEHVQSPNKSGEIFSTFSKTVRLFTINVMNVSMLLEEWTN